MLNWLWKSLNGWNLKFYKVWQYRNDTQACCKLFFSASSQDDRGPGVQCIKNTDGDEQQTVWWTDSLIQIWQTAVRIHLLLFAFRLKRHRSRLPSVLREKKKEQEREELWRKLDELRLQETSAMQNNRHEMQFNYSNRNNNNNLHDNDENTAAITDRSESDTWAEWLRPLSFYLSLLRIMLVY